jgi:hypothetical protein
MKSCFKNIKTIGYSETRRAVHGTALRRRFFVENNYAKAVVKAASRLGHFKLRITNGFCFAAVAARCYKMLGRSGFALAPTHFSAHIFVAQIATQFFIAQQKRQETFLVRRNAPS